LANSCSYRSGQVKLKGPARAMKEALSCRLISERKFSPMTVSSPNVIEVKLARLIDDMRLLRSQMIAFDKQPKKDRSLSQTKRTERTTAREQIETMVRGGC
jgi:hypothetical protein